MATLSVQDVVVTGLEPTLVAAAGGGDDFPNDGLTFLVIDNADASPMTVTVDDTGSVSPVGATAFTPDVDVIVTNGEQRYIGPFPVSRFGNSVALSYTSATSVTVAAVRLRGAAS